MSRVLVAHESETIREVIRRLLEDAGFLVTTAPDGQAALERLSMPHDGLVIDVAIGEVPAYRVVDEVRARGLKIGVVLIASIYNRTGYKRRPTSLYGADAYVEQHHIPDSLVDKLSALIGPPPHKVEAVAAHIASPDGKRIKAAGEERLEALPRSTRATMPKEAIIERAERLARLIVTDIALYNGDALDLADQLGDTSELDARLRLDLEEGRLLFDLRVPEEIRRLRDFIADALAEVRVARKKARESTA